MAWLCSRKAALIGVLILVATFQVYHLFGLHVSKDLPLWDESAYIGWGDEFLQDRKVGSITNSPFYHVLYGGVISVVGLLPSFHAMQYLLKVALTLLVLLLVVRFSRSLALGLLMGAFFSYSWYHLNIDVLVYYGALIPCCAAILVASRAPFLSLGLSFLAGLGRVEYMAVPIVHLLYLGAQRMGWIGGGALAAVVEGSAVSVQHSSETQQAEGRPGRSRGVLIRWHTVAGVLVWLFNLFVLTRITVWQFHNRVWFAWSQNYAFFRYLTGRDSGGNPWLDHQTIAERDFPGADSLADAFAANPTAVIEHTWFNICRLPAYLSGFLVADSHMVFGRTAPVWIFMAICGAGLGAWIFHSRAITTRRHAGAMPAETGDIDLRVEFVLCIGAALAAAPGVLVSTKTNYIMSLLPIVLFTLGVLHRRASRISHYARWSHHGFLLLAIAFGTGSVLSPSPHSTNLPRGQVYEDVLALRRLLQPFNALRILGVSTASYVNYLGRERRHVFIEPLAISPVNQQATDLSLAALLRKHDPDVLLINSWWRSSELFNSAVVGFSFDDWDRYSLRDGDLYLKRGLLLVPQYEHGWYPPESTGSKVWRWSSGDGAISLENAFSRASVIFRADVRSLSPRTLELRVNGRVHLTRQLSAENWVSIQVDIGPLDKGLNRLELRTTEPAAHAGEDPRPLALCVANLELESGAAHP